MFPSGAGSEPSENQGEDPATHRNVAGPSHPNPPEPSAIPGENSSETVEQPIPKDKPYVALLLLEGERKRVIDEMIHFVEARFLEAGLPPGACHEKALRFLWEQFLIDQNPSVDELKYYKKYLFEKTPNSICRAYKILDKG